MKSHALVLPARQAPEQADIWAAPHFSEAAWQAPVRVASGCSINWNEMPYSLNKQKRAVSMAQPNTVIGGAFIEA
jgi:hypothetical protein